MILPLIVLGHMEWLSAPQCANFDDSADDHIVNGPALRCNFIVYTAILAEPNVYNAKNRSIQLLF